jgi:hypothetical protein
MLTTGRKEFSPPKISVGQIELRGLDIPGSPAGTSAPAAWAVVFNNAPVMTLETSVFFPSPEGG